MSQQNIFCIYCGKENLSQAQFCHFCGKPMPENTLTGEMTMTSDMNQTDCPYCGNPMRISEDVTSLVCSSCAASMAVIRENGVINFCIQEFKNYQ